ncbi:UNVERIFIED_CONTAM: hypothetical protein K2H54_041969 [Gekko kuhli]
MWHVTTDLVFSPSKFNHASGLHIQGSMQKPTKAYGYCSVFRSCNQKLGSNDQRKNLEINNAGIVYTETLAVRQKMLILKPSSADIGQEAICQADPGVRIVDFPEVLHQSPFLQMQDQYHHHCWTVVFACPSSWLYSVPNAQALFEKAWCLKILPILQTMALPNMS